MTSAIPPIQFGISADGITTVTSALKSLEDRIASFETGVTRKQQEGAAKRKSAKDKEYDALKRLTEKWAQEEAQTESRKTKQSAAEAKKAAAQRKSAKEKEFSDLQRQTEKWARDELNAEKRKNAQVEAEHKRSASSRASFFNKVAGNAVQNMRNMASKALGLVAAVGAVGGGFSIADSLGTSVKNQGKAKEISQNSMGQATKDQVYQAAKGVSGFSTEEVLGGIDQFVAKSGDTDMALKSMKQIGVMANATGVDLKDLATSAALAWNSMSADEKAKGPEGLMNVLRTQIGQGRLGPLDIREMAPNMNRILNGSAQFEGGMTKNAEFMGALVQDSVTKGTSTDSAEASESAKSLALDLQTHQKQLGKAGITGIFDKYGRLKDLQHIQERLMVGTNGDLGKLEQAGVERRSVRLFEGPAIQYKNAYADAKKAGKSEKDARQAGLNASNKEIDTYMGGQVKGKSTEADLQKQNDERLQEADKKLTDAFNKLRDTVGDKLVPELLKVIPVVSEMIPKIASLTDSFIKIAEWILNNPFKAAFLGLGAAATKAIVGELVAAGLAKAVAGVLGNLGGGKGPPVPGAGPGGAPGGNGVGTAAAGIAAAVSLNGAVAGINLLTSGEPGVNADNIRRRAKAGDPEALAKLKEVEEEGTGIWGDTKRGLKGMLATPLMGLGIDSGKEWYQNIATRQSVSEQINNGSISTPEQQAAAVKAQEEINQRKSVAEESAVKAAEEYQQKWMKLQNELNNLQPPTPPIPKPNGSERRPN